ncbi:MAG TPA: DNA polymerase IV [Nitrospiria bacterium]|jgi:DNA polymerase IV (DinB-like DNA polymerase)
MPTRIIGHLDMDAFFAAIEELNNPRLKGLPMVVGADPQDGKGRGVVSTSNYPARVYGIYSAMPITQAWGRSEAAKRRGDPPVVFVRPHFTRYTEVSGKISLIVRKHVPLVEEASIDEMYLDLSFAGSFEKAQKICQEIKKEIHSKENLTASIGIGPNKLIAKIASDFKKPDGLTLVKESDAETFVAPMSVRRIPGIGPKTEARLVEQGIRVVKDLKRFTKEEMKEMFGKWGLDLYEKVRGRDDSPVLEDYEVKSVGEQETFPEDTRNSDFILKCLMAMAKNVMARFFQLGFKTFRTVVVIVRFSDFETKTRSRTISEPSGSQKKLETEAIKLLLPFLDRRENPKKKMFRLIGIRIEKLEK